MGRIGRVAVGVVVAMLILGQIPVMASGHMATLGEFQGEVMVKTAESWTRPEPDMPLFSGSKIVTKNGTALVRFKDGATLFIDAFSSIRAIDTLLPQDRDGKNRIRKVRIMLGRAKYEEQPVKERETRIELPTAVAALRGTGGWFGAGEDQTSLGSLYEGQMETFGLFQEMVPKLLTLARALNSPTFQASLASSQAESNPILNLREIRSEFETFAANTDPEVRSSVSRVMDAIAPLLTSVEAKIEQARMASEIKAKAAQSAGNVEQAAGNEAALDAAEQIGASAAAAADAFLNATQDSMNADLVLVLETLKGDEAGLLIARAAKEQNDLALGVAQTAVETLDQALDLVSTSTDAVQLETAAAVADTAKNLASSAARNIRTINVSVVLTARDSDTEAREVAVLIEKTGNVMALAQNTAALAKQALTASSKNPALALSVARAAQTTSKATWNAAQIGFQAARAIQENPGTAQGLKQAAQAAAESVRKAAPALDTLKNALDTGNSGGVEDATKTINDATQATDTIRSEAGVPDDGIPAAPEAFEAAEPETGPAIFPEPDFNPQDDFLDDARPASPI